ncbi:MAG: hypothetical protein U9M91_00745 [Chloroflexota bacterium]|nr:hypothetical protein [Chloroflexota bacterium]
MIIAEEAIKIVRQIGKGKLRMWGKLNIKNAKRKKTGQNMTNPKPEMRNPKQKKGKI